MTGLVQYLDLKGHLVCFIISSSYITSLYLIPRSVRDTARDNPSHIRCRMLAAASSTILSGIMCYFCFQSWNFPLSVTFLEACGIRLDTSLAAIYASCMLMSIFYLGPVVTTSVYLYASYFYGVDGSGNIGEKRGIDRFSSFFAYVWDMSVRYKKDFGDLIIIRNLIFAPISEEIAFRALMIPALCAVYYYSYNTSQSLSTELSDLANISKNSCRSDTFIFKENFGLLSENSLDIAEISSSEATLSLLYASVHGMKDFQNKWHVTYELSPWRAVLTCPLWFVAAHIHHCIEKIKSGYTIFQALLGTVIQATYTSVFGIIAALLFMRTGNILAPITSHIICNFIGLPNLGFLDKAGNYRSSEYSFMFPYKNILLIIHAVGLLLFCYFVFPFTENMALNSIYWHGILTNCTA